MNFTPEELPFLHKKRQQEAERTQQEEEMEEMRKELESIPRSTIVAMALAKIRNGEQPSEELQEAMAHHKISPLMFRGSGLGR